MSHETYNELWKNAQDLLASTVQSEPTQADSREQRKLLATLYLRYIVIANKLSECVDQMVQPQKRALVRKVLEATLGRILELKSDLVEADLCEYTHFGDVLDSLNYTPLHTELQIPACFRNDRRDELDYRNGTIHSVLNKLGYLDKVDQKPPMTHQQAIRIVQTHERARQGRLRAQFMREIKNMKDRSKPAVADEEDGAEKISLPAALRIQKVWRGYQARRATRRRKLQEMLLIGMVPPPKKDNEDVVKCEKHMEERRKLQMKRQVEYENAINECRERMEKEQRAVVLEQLSDQVRTWLYEYREQTGKIPEFTGSERSTSRMLMSRQGASTGTDSEVSKSTQISSKESKRSKSKQKEIKTEDEGEETIVKAMVSVFVPELNIRKEEYNEIWKDKDETTNPHQLHYADIIEQEQMTSMENELRKLVDEMMRSELQLLQDALDRDRGHKARKPKKASKTKRGSKKGKKKKEKDLTPDRTTESLFEELIANGIIKSCPNVYLKDFIGERSYNPPAIFNEGDEPKLSLGDVRQIVAEYCIVPLLTTQLHLTTPHVKSVLLAGAVGSGKDMLVQAVCHEAGATLFDLTPANIVGKYPGKSGLIMLIHLVTKVARLLQPSVIFMDNAERPFVKKIPKTDKTDPKRLKKDLPKLVKNLCPEDRVVLIGVTNCPWEADQKLMQQVYQKMLMIPRPEYSSRFTLWTQLLSQNNSMSWQFDYSGLTKISDGYTVGAITSTINEVMTVKRKLQLRVQPLSPLELINALAKRIPVYKEEEEALYTWWSKTPMVKRRTRAIELLITQEEEQKAKLANAKRN